MIRLIAIDLDGTLLTDDKQLPPGFRETAVSLLSRGVGIVIATGRPYHNVVEVFEDLNDQLYFACDNGSYVVYNQKELLVKPLRETSVKKFIELSRSLDCVYPVLCGKDLAFIEHTDPEFMDQALKYYKEYKIVDDLTKVRDLVLKLSLCDLEGAETNSYPHFRKFENDYSIAVSGQIWLDITDPNSNKGTAVAAIQGHLNVSAEDTLVFGDYLNDLDMIRNAGHSYAMKNAHPEIIQAAKHITQSDNNNYGVMEVINEFFSF